MEEVEKIKKESLSLTDWLITLLITSIPFVGFIMLFVWAFSSNTHASKANWAKACLILLAIGIALAITILAVFGVTFLGILDTCLINPTEY